MGSTQPSCCQFWHFRDILNYAGQRSRLRRQRGHSYRQLRNWWTGPPTTRALDPFATLKRFRHSLAPSPSPVVSALGSDFNGFPCPWIGLLSFWYLLSHFWSNCRCVIKATSISSVQHISLWVSNYGGVFFSFLFTKADSICLINFAVGRWTGITLHIK